MLLMISNRYMSLRERYSTVLDNHPDGWITSFMSALPSDIEAIAGGYDAVIYELGAPDSADRVADVQRIRALGVAVLTHLEGRGAAEKSAALAAQGVVVLPMPLTGTAIEDALDRLGKQKKTDQQGSPRLGVRGFFRRLLNGS